MEVAAKTGHLPGPTAAPVAKAAGVYQHKSVEDIADLLDVSRATAFRYVKAARRAIPAAAS
jgi:hypothetical protein